MLVMVHACYGLQCHPCISHIHRGWLLGSDWIMGALHSLVDEWVIAGFIVAYIVQRTKVGEVSKWGCVFGVYLSVWFFDSLFNACHRLSSFPQPYPFTMSFLLWSQQTWTEISDTVSLS